VENPDISGDQYQHGDLFYHKNFKQACLVRDKFKCRVCKAQSNLQCHHVKPRSKGGTDKLSNLMTLCKDCHDRHHKEGLKLPRQKVLSMSQQPMFSREKLFTERIIQDSPFDKDVWIHHRPLPKQSRDRKIPCK